MYQTTSDLSNRVNVYADMRFLVRAVPNNIIGQWGQQRPLPKGKGKTISFRKYNKLDATPVVLQEGVTPSGKTNTVTDVTATIYQYGDWVGITDAVQDTCEDNVLNENIDLLAEQSGEMYDLIRIGILKAGTNVQYANGTARSSVNTVISQTLLRKAERILGRQEAKYITEKINAGPNIGTSPIAAAYVAPCHIDCKMDISDLPDFVPVYEYANMGGIFQGEIGASGAFRFVIDNNIAPWEDAGGAKGGCISTTGTSADVYPILIFGKDAYGLISLAGAGSVQTYVVNPKAVIGDPLAQKGTIGWKGWTAAVILNDMFMLRLEVGCTNG
jgi:N4-gp56 family major capsid protein